MFFSCLSKFTPGGYLAYKLKAPVSQYSLLKRVHYSSENLVRKFFLTWNWSLFCGLQFLVPTVLLEAHRATLVPLQYNSPIGHYYAPVKMSNY